MNKVVQISLIVVLAALLLAGGFMAGSFYNRPLATPMDVEIPTATAAAPVVGASQVEKTATVEKKPETCGSTGVTHVLLTGADFSEGVEPFGADAVRLLQVDFDDPSVTVVAFPRDMLVNTPALSDLNIVSSPLGLAYHYRKEATQGADKHRVTTATQLLAQTLYDNFAYPSAKKDYYYLTLQLNEIGGMIDTIGGVEITLPTSITSDHGIVFPAGKQTLNGALSAEYLRTGNPGGDAARLKRQNLYAKALQAKILSAGVLAELPDLMKQFDKAIVTDLSPKQIQSLACMMQEVPQNEIEFYEIGIENGLVTPGQGRELIPDVEKIKTSLKDWFGE